MRIYLKLTKNKEPIPFNYQHLLTGTIHKWIGKDNKEHGDRSFYSFSWLQNTSSTKKGINIERDGYFFISSHDSEFIKKIVKGILETPEMFCGIQVMDVQIKNTPNFSNKERFILSSPVLIRKKVGDKTKHVIYSDKDFESLLTQNFKRKLGLNNIPSDDISIEKDKSYAFPQTKLVNYKNIKNKTSLLPIIIKGRPEQIAFAWEVGLGESTGVGFGALK